MVVHEFGNKNKPLLLLLPGTCCYWKSNFQGVLPELEKTFFVCIVAYSGFDEAAGDRFTTMEEETRRLETHVKEHYGNRIHAAYGCSLGGSFVALLAARGNIQMGYGIIGSSDFDQSGRLAARLKTALVGKVMYPYVQNGRYDIRFLQRRVEKRRREADPYHEAFDTLMGCGKYDLSFISKTSVKNQFYSDLITKVPDKIDPPETEIHVMYAKKMGGRYLERYHKHFARPVIHEYDLRHEELLGLYPEKWAEEVKQICRVRETK